MEDRDLAVGSLVFRAEGRALAAGFLAFPAEGRDQATGSLVFRAKGRDLAVAAFQASQVFQVAAKGHLIPHHHPAAMAAKTNIHPDRHRISSRKRRQFKGRRAVQASMQ
ncbi:hypothetical protein KH172YL63_09500 [Bacillus sp. KH172YL63]|nr:hypothetical protein KH172YL63_09500 [Bacillus sp. KH172YL63]